MRVENVNIPNNKRAVISLTYIYGIGKPLAKKILREAKLSEDKRIKDFSESELSRLRTVIRKARETDVNFRIEGDLRTAIKFDIKRLQEIKSYRGIRHKKGLPVRGQSTRQNARTWKGPKKTVANKKKAPK